MELESCGEKIIVLPFLVQMDVYLKTTYLGHIKHLYKGLARYNPKIYRQPHLHQSIEESVFFFFISGLEKIRSPKEKRGKKKS